MLALHRNIDTFITLVISILVPNCLVYNFLLPVPSNSLILYGNQLTTLAAMWVLHSETILKSFIYITIFGILVFLTTCILNVFFQYIILVVYKPNNVLFSFRFNIR